MRIVVLDGYAANPGDLSWTQWEKLGELMVYDRTKPEDVIERIGTAEIVLTNKVVIDQSVMDACPNLRYIGVLATGYNVVDVQCAKQHGIIVTNVPAYSTDATAQFAIALLLDICLHVAHHDSAVHEGRWTNAPDFCFWDYPLIELKGKTLGVIGLGRIGRKVAQIAGALGMKVIAFNRSQCDEGHAVATYVDLDTLFAQSDVITLHCPLTEATNGIICRKNIEKMKDSVVIINNARGGLIVEQDLADALNEGKVYAAAADVASTEPIQKDNPLLTARHMIITPHISWAPTETRERLMDIARSNVAAFIEEKPVNVVNA